MLLVVVAVSLLAFGSTVISTDPLGQPFAILKSENEHGCDVGILPESIIWCNGSLNVEKRLPESTWCQSHDQDAPYLFCRGGRWNSRWNLNFEEGSGRYRRDIGRAVTNLTEQTCQYLCVDDLTGVYTYSVPQYSSCPASVTLHPEGEDPNVTHSWEQPVAEDTDGIITKFSQIVGPPSPATFASALNPGLHYVISYMATDDDNLRWPCDFKVIAEVPFCPPIVHIDNGNITCTNANSRDSNCTITCIVGYYVNGSTSAVCQDNGTWTYGEEVPQCLPVVCEADLGPGNYTGIELICENDTLVYNTVCWLQCMYNNTLINNEELSRILNVLLSNINETMNASTIAREAAENARDLADFLQIVAEDALADYILAFNNSDKLRNDLSTVESELASLIIQQNQTEAELILCQTQADNATLNNDPNADILNAKVDNLTETLDVINTDVNETQLNIISVNQSLQNALVAVEQAKNLSEEAQSNYTQADTLASELLIAADAAAAAASAAVLAYTTAQQYSVLANVEIPTFVRCQANGTWAIEGEPFCLDISVPTLSCIPFLTAYLDIGQTSRVVNWTLPVVYDNSPNVTIVRLSGPEPGDNLTQGQHVAMYMATDVAGSSTYCNTYINVEVRSCGFLDDHTNNANLTYDCDSFEQGAVCNLTCNNYQNVTDPGIATCELDTSSSTSGVSWNLHAVTCEAESCPVPPFPQNGVLDCFGVSNTSSNSTNTTSSDCTIVCNTGYMTPYQVSTTYTCNNDGTWTPSEFPDECIPAGSQKSSSYNLVLTATTTDDVCNFFEMEMLINTLQPVLDVELATYLACASPYNCSLVISERACSDGADETMLQLDIAVTITCEGSPLGDPSEVECDLSQNVMNSLVSSFNQSFLADNLLMDTQLSYISVQALTSSLPFCVSGILVGHYCAQCPKGTFYNSDQDTCTKCGIKSYQYAYHSNACITCSATDSTRTGTSGATSSSQCIPVCTPGMYSYTTVEPCVSCPTGTYQDLSGSSECTSCPNNTWTTIQGGIMQDDCIGYDIYFNTAQMDFVLNNATDQMTIAFWMKNDNPPLVSIGVFYDTTDFAFVFEAGGTNAQLLFNSVQNTPTGISFEAHVWALVGITWDCPVVTVYKDGVQAYNFDLQDTCGQSSKLVMSASSGTLLSGLGVSNAVADSAEMMLLYEDCSHRLASTTFSMDGLAALRMSTINFVPTNCTITNETAADDICAVHLCENAGVCVVNNDTGYSCNCTELYAGPFCEEELVHGNWSEWINGSSCSSTCGPGVQLQYRYCNNPTKSFYGNDCEGNRTEIVECNLEDCVECASLEEESGTYCDLVHDECTPMCPPGLVLPKGQQNQTFKCGEATNSEWVPLNRLPICAVSLQPVCYTVEMTFTLADPVPCSKVTGVTAEFASLVPSLRCVQNGTCEAQFSVTDCGVGSSHLVLSLTSPLTNTETFDLLQYYNSTLALTDSISEAVLAIYMLELTVKDLLDNPGSLSVVFEGITYAALNSTDSVTVVARTNCSPGQVPTQGVCTICQKGTYMVGEWCLYCPRGTYSEVEGQIACTLCPYRYTTLYLGSRNISECYEAEPSPSAVDYLVIILSIVFGIIGIIMTVLAVCLCRRLYFGYKEREKHDMEADRISLYTDFPDIAYNVFFKRRMVLGFDEDGLPIISKTPVQNGDIPHGDPDKITLEHDVPGEPEEVPVPGKGNEPFAYPTDYDEPPFDYDPYCLWPEDSVPPPVIPEPDFDFPLVSGALRYRVPGRSHLEQVYPLHMFGYTEKVRGRTRKLLPLPAAIPLPKKLPKLMYRPPKPISLMEQLKAKFGIKTRRDTDGMDTPLLSDFEEESIPPQVPPLSFKSKSLQPPHRAKSKVSVDSWSVRRPRKKLTERAKSARMLLKASIDKRSPRASPTSSPRFAKSAVGFSRLPRSLSSLTPRIARSAGTGPRLVDEDMDHPKPSRFVVPKGRPEPRSMLKSAEPVHREPRPATSLLTGRKSVTIKEGDMITRPTTAVTDFDQERRSSVRTTRDVHLTPYHSRPWSSLYSAEEDVNIFDLDWVSSEYGGTSRPSTAASRPYTSLTRSTAVPRRAKTPSIHPAPQIHGNVKVVSHTPDFNMLRPKSKLKFGAPPLDHKAKFMAPPPVFKNKIKPKLHADVPEENTRPAWEDVEDSDNYEEEEDSEHGSFFLTEVPDVRKDSGRLSKDPSPPLPYSEYRKLRGSFSSSDV